MQVGGEDLHSQFTRHRNPSPVVDEILKKKHSYMILWWFTCRSPTQLDDDDEDLDEEDADGNTSSFWQEMPDSILLHIFSFLDEKNLCTASAVCKVMMIKKKTIGFVN